MSIEEQMKNADEISILENETQALKDKARALSKEVTQIIKQYKENTCNKIKNEIFDKGKDKNFAIQDKITSWSMKYKSLIPKIPLKL